MPIDRTDFTTSEPDIGNQTLNDVYGAGRAMTFWGASADFDFRLRTNKAGELSADRLRHSMAAGATTDPFDTFIAARVLRGSLRFASNGEDRVVHHNGFLRYPSEAELECDWADVDLELLRVPLTSIDAAASIVSDAPARVTFFSMQAASPAKAEKWVSLSTFVHESIKDEESPANQPIVARALTELVASTALDVFPNSVTTRDYTRSPGRVGMASTRRAAEFIETHAGEPFTVTDVAAAAGVSARAVQLAFRRYYGVTPMAYARRVRLERAHVDLQQADPQAGASVKAIAARWGFNRPDRFSVLYRRQHGVLPSRTLHG